MFLCVLEDMQMHQQSQPSVLFHVLFRTQEQKCPPYLLNMKPLLYLETPEESPALHVCFLPSLSSFGIALEGPCHQAVVTRW